jgi:predicted XRE-type DNA-binding protein
VLATALREELCRVNNMTIDDLSPDEWRVAVMAELEAEAWIELSEISRKSQKGEGHKTPHAKRKVLDYLQQHPEAFSLKQSEIAEILDVSVPTVSRAVNAYQRNGHGGSED